MHKHSTTLKTTKKCAKQLVSFHPASALFPSLEASAVNSFWCWKWCLAIHFLISGWSRGKDAAGAPPQASAVSSVRTEGLGAVCTLAGCPARSQRGGRSEERWEDECLWGEGLGPTSKLLGLTGGERDSGEAVVISSAPMADPLAESLWVLRFGGNPVGWGKACKSCFLEYLGNTEHHMGTSPSQQVY